VISIAQRRKIHPSKFVYPPTKTRAGRYPIDTPKRARAALRYSAQPRTFGTYATVARAVRKRYGNTIKSVAKKGGDLKAPSGKRANISRPTKGPARYGRKAARGRR
jgi:hypothetical protein